MTKNYSLLNFVLTCIGILFSTLAFTQTAIYDSGGVPMDEQLVYDVTYYDLDLEVIPEKKWIEGSITITVNTLQPFKEFVVNLDTLLIVNKVSFLNQGTEQSTLWNHSKGLLWIHSNQEFKRGEIVKVKIYYSGHPLSVSGKSRGSWADGFFWEKTASGKPWVGNVSVLNGADIWWPCKDHPSDEADSMSIRITVPKGLIVAANGKLIDQLQHGSLVTFHWFISTPINNYAVTINIAPYQTIHQTFTSVNGDTFPFTYWVLPENYEKGLKQFPLFIRDMQFFEKILGPYPFRADKYGIAETYYLGMETQSIIAYGNDYSLNEYGFDFLHFHELAHEWFANMVTARDWKDWWIHEGFASYTEALYAEHLMGEKAYHQYVSGFIKNSKNQHPIVLSQPHVSARTGYIGDVYGKGAAILHSLRFLMGKDKMLAFLRQVAYPDPKLEKVTDGSHCRLVSTQDVENIAESVFGRDLDWFFDTYLLYAVLPELHVVKKKKKLRLAWHTSDESTFLMPVPIQINGKQKLVPMVSGKAKIKMKSQDFQIDPENRILKTLVVE